MTESRVSYAKQEAFNFRNPYCRLGPRRGSSDAPPRLTPPFHSRGPILPQFRGARVAPNINNVCACTRACHRHAPCAAVYLRRCTPQFSTQRQGMRDKLPRRISSGMRTRCIVIMLGIIIMFRYWYCWSALRLIYSLKIQKIIYQTEGRVPRVEYFSRVRLHVSK